MNVKMTAPLILILSTCGFVAMGFPISNAEVVEKEAAYSCCGNPQIIIDQSCDVTFQINSTTIAYSKGGVETDCVLPCKKIGALSMTLASCVAVKAEVVCPSAALGQKTVKNETWINYSSSPCPGSAGTQGSNSLLLLLLLLPALVICGLMIRKIILYKPAMGPEGNNRV